MKVAGGMVSIGLTNTVSARSENHPNKVYSKGFGKQIQKALQKDGPDGARQLFEKHGLAYNISTGTPKFDRDNSSDITIQNQYPEDESTVSAILGGRHDEDRVWFTSHVEFSGEKDRLEPASNVDDVISVMFDEDDWSIVGEPSVNVHYEYDGYGDPEPLDAGFHSGSIDSGLSATVDVDAVSDPDNVRSLTLIEGTVSIMTQLKNETNTPSPLWAAYEHTGAATSGGSILDISLDVGFGGLNVNLGGGASELWNVAKPADPEDYISA